jgi:putative superfamily III holin-X
MTVPSGPAGPKTAGIDVGEVSVGELMTNVTKDLSTLLRQELALAKAELKEEVAKAGKSAGAFGGAGFSGYMVLLFLSFALWWGLANGMDQGWAALIVAAVWAVAGAVLYAVGRREGHRINPTPERTVETIKQVPNAVKGK